MYNERLDMCTQTKQLHLTPPIFDLDINANLSK